MNQIFYIFIKILFALTVYFLNCTIIIEKHFFLMHFTIERRRTAIVTH